MTNKEMYHYIQQAECDELQQQRMLEAEWMEKEQYTLEYQLHKTFETLNERYWISGGERRKKLFQFNLERLMKKFGEQYSEEYLIDFINKKFDNINWEQPTKFVVNNESPNLATAKLDVNEIHFNVKQLEEFFERLKQGKDEYDICYKHENELMKKHVETDYDYLRWMMCHEFNHILRPEARHGKKFSQQVLQMYLALPKTEITQK